MKVGRGEFFVGQALLLALMALTILPFISIFMTALHPSGTVPSGFEWPADPQWGNFVEAFNVSNVFFFQAEDGIRDGTVTGVQTCALPIFDSWSNYNAHNTEVNIPAGTPTVNNAPTLPGQDDTVVTPRAAAIYHASDKISVWGDVGAGFRAPTLNELYRRFSKGTVLTLPNFALGPERLVGGELGVNLAPVKNVTTRATWFYNRVHNPVSNVTILTQGANVTVQRQNLGETAIQGVQLDAEYHINKNWR